MRRLPVVCAVAIALLLAGAAPPLALAASSPHHRSAEPHSAILSLVWGVFRDFVALMDSGHGLDPNGQPSTSADSGHELDPNG